MNKRMTHIRAYEPDKIRLKELSFELSAIQRSKVSTPEIIKRALNIPRLKDILMNDAEFKRRIGRR